MIEIRKNYKYAVGCVTSMGLRLTPEGRMSVHNSNIFYMQATSAETNVLNISSSLGYQCLALTKFVKDSPVSLFIQRELRKRNIDYLGKEVDQEGPWGYRHQINIADSGFGNKASRVWNDRAGEVGLTLDVRDYDTKKLFEEEGVAIFHISGLVAALSLKTADTCIKLAEIAKKNGTLISFDLNYRASFWKGRSEELSKAFRKIAQMADILIGNEEDFQLALGIEGQKEGGKDIKTDNFIKMLERVKKDYPNTKIFATTLREVIDANNNLWGCVCSFEGQILTEEPRSIAIMDRIGGGDGFTGGLLYGVLKGYDNKKCMQLAWASGALAVSSLNDYAEPTDEKQLIDIYYGNARIQR